MLPYYEHGGITIYHADCRDVLPCLTERPALVLTDPPYGVDLRTDNEQAWAEFELGAEYYIDFTRA